MSSSSSSSLPVFVYGHLNPDIDAVVSTLIGAMYLECMGIPAKPVLLSPMDRITRDVIENDLGITEPPPVVTDWAGVIGGHRVFLVDHHTHANGVGSEIGATLDVIGCIDHHMGNFSVNCPREGPLCFYVPEYPSASYMLVLLMQKAGFPVSREVLRWALAASLVDTCCLRMPDPHNQRPTVMGWVAQLGLNFSDLEEKYLFDIDPSLPLDDTLSNGPKTFEKNGFRIETTYIEIYKATPERREALCKAVKYLFEKYRSDEATRNIRMLFVKDFEKNTTKYFCAGSKEFSSILFASKAPYVDEVSGEVCYKVDGIHGRNSFVSLFYSLVEGK